MDTRARARTCYSRARNLTVRSGGFTDSVERSGTRDQKGRSVRERVSPRARTSAAAPGMRIAFSPLVDGPRARTCALRLQRAYTRGKARKNQPLPRAPRALIRFHPPRERRAPDVYRPDIPGLGGEGGPLLATATATATAAVVMFSRLPPPTTEETESTPVDRGVFAPGGRQSALTLSVVSLGGCCAPWLRR